MARAREHSRGNGAADYEASTEYSQTSETFGEVNPAPDPLQSNRTARRIAYFLVSIMAFTVVGHYTLTLVLGLMGGEDATIELISGIFRTWLPLIAGFAGGAITFFLTDSA